MRDVPDRRKQVLDRAAFLRGTIITSYAQVEHLLANLSVRCRNKPEYSLLTRTFPYRLESRLKAVRAAAGTGPLATYRAELVPPN